MFESHQHLDASAPRRVHQQSTHTSHTLKLDSVDRELVDDDVRLTPVQHRSLQSQILG